MKIDLFATQYTMGGRLLDMANVLDDLRGLTGTELNFIGVACALSQRGQTVRAFVPLKEEMEIDGVQFCHIDKYNRSTDKSDVVVTYHDSTPLDWANGDMKIASHHVYIPPILNFHSAKYNTAPSQPAVLALRNGAPLSYWRVLPNGVDLGDFRPWSPVRGRLIYHTSSTRGLHLLLEALPEIQKRVPGAHLHVLGRHDWVDPWLKQGYPQMRSIAEKVSSALKNPPPGVTFLDQMSRNETLREISEASCFPFPCSVIMPCETFSVSLMETCFIGVPVVLCPVDALAHIYGGAVSISPAPPEFFLDEFAERVVKVLIDGAESTRLSLSEQQLAKSFTFESAASKLEDIIAGKLVL